MPVAVVVAGVAAEAQHLEHEEGEQHQQDHRVPDQDADHQGDQQDRHQREAERRSRAPAALAASSVAASRGEPEPGSTVAPAVVLAGLAPVLVVGLLGRAVFLSDAGPAVPQGLATGWVVAGVVAAGVLAVSCRDPGAGRHVGAAATGSRARRSG